MTSASDPYLFWAIAIAMVALALAFVLPGIAARRPRQRARHQALNAAIYRGELAQLDRKRAEGTVAVPDYERSRAEIERRLLADAIDDRAPVASPLPGPRIAIAVAIALPALAFGLYALFGDPAALDAPHATASADASLSIDGRDALVRHLERNPHDGRGWVLLARTDFGADRFADAATAYGKAIAASPKVASDPGIWCEYADALGMAQGGTLGGRPRELVLHALSLDAAHPRALEMAGSAAYEQRDYATAARLWRQLLAQLPDGSQEHRELTAALARIDSMNVAAGNPRGTRP
jgi:cytochrome c-type biogenesis protein CcmH